MNALKNLAALIGRLSLVAIFLGSAFNKISSWDGTLAYMQNGALHEIPMPEVALPAAVGFLVLGGISVVLGFWTRLGAFLLMCFLGAASYFFHSFWTMEQGGEQTAEAFAQAKQMQQIQFMKNLGLMGGLFLLIGHGPGAFSIDGDGSSAGGGDDAGDEG